MTDLTTFTSDYLTASQLARVSDATDKREGSIIYDTIAPTSVELATYYTNLTEVQKQAYASTATGAFLDLIVAEAGLSRFSATYTQKLVSFADANGNPMSVALGSRFSTMSTNTPINYYLLSAYTNASGVVVSGSYIAVCEILGTDGNGYTGNILPITFISGLTTAIMADTLQPGADAEDDDTLRARYFDKITQKAFGGNVAQYTEWLTDISGVGTCQVYPTWNGGGTVKCSIIDTSFNTCSTTFINTVQTLIDPTLNSGMGLGYAPIGHQVTIVTPSEFPVNFYTKVVLANGYNLTTVTSTISTALSNYILNLRKNWGVGDSVNRYYANIYYAKAMAVIMGCAGVANVSILNINGSSSDIILTQSGLNQQLPKLGTVQATT